MDPLLEFDSCVTQRLSVRMGSSKQTAVQLHGGITMKLNSIWVSLDTVTWSLHSTHSLGK